ncbi:hypothetical protein Cgig2_027298 [Carnegiea gigantea]|uniref:Uncharacterized protein n=1 Tax=Carnegiea gigantea TaxID=171969 RepID=A0A9Q1JGG2_9CARY|nr:hypothetical protein Cgig2_027298 [Carnegiea gigantea]
MKAVKHDPKPIQGFEYEPIPGFIMRNECPEGEPNTLSGETLEGSSKPSRPLRKLTTTSLSLDPSTLSEEIHTKSFFTSQLAKGKLNHFSRQDRGDNQVLHNPGEKKDNDTDSDIEVIATIVRGVNNKEIRKLSQVLATKRLKPLIRPTMMFGPKDIRPLQTL